VIARPRFALKCIAR